MVRVIALVVFFALIAVYAAPSVIVILRGQRRWPLVVALNMLLGWTILGWVAALAMSLGLPRRAKLKPRVRRQPPTRPAATQIVADDDVSGPAREPPKLSDDSYARWLDGGSAMTA